MPLEKMPNGAVRWIYQGGDRQPTLTDKMCDSYIAHFFDVFIFLKAAFIVFMSIKGIIIWRKSKFLRCQVITVLTTSALIVSPLYD